LCVWDVFEIQIYVCALISVKGKQCVFLTHETFDCILYIYKHEDIADGAVSVANENFDLVSVSCFETGDN